MRKMAAGVVLGVVLGGAAAWASNPVGTPATLRAAAAHLARTYGAAYACDTSRLARVAADAPAPADFPELQRAVLLAHPVLRRHPLLFVVRKQYRPDHHNTETMFQTGEINTGSYEAPGILRCLDWAAGGAVRTLADLGPTAVTRDPDVSFDGKRILFSGRRSRDDDYHLYEVGADGSGLRQLTRSAGVTDIDPLYLPDGAIAFTSTREPKYCMCNRHIMGNLFRMDADGANITQIGRSTLHEGHGSLLPDGRILYDRWEYIDRNFGDAQALWTVNPDGTGHAIYWGSNLSSPGAALDGRPLPDGYRALCIWAACHDRPWGALALIDRRQGVDTRASVVRTWPPEAVNVFKRGGFDSTTGLALKYEDPWPLDDDFYLVARAVAPRSDQMGIYLVDTFGNEVLVHAEAPGCFDPMPLGPRARPPIIPPRRTYDAGTGRFYVQNAGTGTHLNGVAPGTARFLRVVESPEKRAWTQPAWGGQGQQAPAMNWHNFESKRILGTVPIAADGSAYFACPADRYVFFQLLDGEGRMLQSMRSGTIIQSGELQGCIGCHESRLGAPAARPLPAALRGPARTLDGWYGPPREFSFMAEVQPVLTRHCVGCHDFGKPGARKVVLAPDRDVVFNAAYTELWSKGLIHCVGAGPAEIQPARSWGSHASRLIEVLRAGHQKVQLSAEEMDRLVTWVDLNAPYYPRYETAYPGGLAGRGPLTGREWARLRGLTGMGEERVTSHGSCRICVSFDRPALSPLLAAMPAPQGAAYSEALAIVQAGQAALAARPRGDELGFALCPVDEARQQKYARGAAAETASRLALSEGRKVYDEE